MSESLCAVCDHCGVHAESGIRQEFRNAPAWYPTGWYILVTEPASQVLAFCSLKCATENKEAS